VLHDVAHAWFEGEGQRGWATCPLTQNGVLRVLGHPQYPGTGSPNTVAPLLSGLVRSRHHEFWPDDISLLDSARVDSQRLLSAARLTDTYLLALAAAHGGQLATLDMQLTTEAVRGGTAALRRIGGSRL
jgi:hypothetical protein